MRIAGLLTAGLLVVAAAPAAAAQQSPARPGRAAEEWRDTARLRFWIDQPLVALGLPRLRDVERRPGRRELRVTSGPSTGRITRRWILRVVEEDGAATGELFYFWPGRDSASAPPRAWGCAEGAAEVMRGRVCRVRLRHAPDWRLLAAALDSLGAWRLPRQPTPATRNGSMVNHAPFLLGEYVDGSRHGAYWYHAPQLQDYPESRRAVGIFHLLADVAPPLRHELSSAPGRMSLSPPPWR